MILLDTHTVLWLMTNPAELSPRVVRAVRAASVQATGAAISDITLWELARLLAKNRIHYPHPLGQLLERVEGAFVVLPISRRVAEIGQQFSARYPKDPADRIVGATAVAHGLVLATRDKRIRASGEVECIW